MLKNGIWKSFWWALFLGLVLPLLSPASSGAQSSSDIVWRTYDVTIDVREDGTMHITERQLISFDGSYSHGFAIIPLNRVEDIENVDVSIANDPDDEPEPSDFVRSSRYDQDPGTFTYSRAGGELSIDYGFENTTYRGGERLVVLEYDVIGGIRVYEDLAPANQQVWWMAISDEVTSVAPIEQATVTLNLPEAVASDQTVIFPKDATVSGETYTWTKSNLGEGDDFEVRLQFPPITAATAPDWQLRDDQIRQNQQEAEERSALAGTILLIAGLILTFGGGAGIYVLWFTKGKDPGVGKIAEYLTEPPDDLRPGPVGTLLDETASTREVVATVLDLARRGVLSMNNENGATTVGQDFKLLEHNQTLEPYEQTVLNAIFGAGMAKDAATKLPTLTGSLHREAEQMYDGFYQELIAHKYVDEAPDDTRRRWKTIFRIMPVLVLVASVAISIVVGGWSGWIVFPLVVGALLFLLAGRLANSMPVKTVAGAEAAAKWDAFRTYLDQLDARQDLAESKSIFDKYLPFAVAMGLAESWVDKFRYVPPPQWTGMPATGGWGGDTWTGGNRRAGRGGNWTTSDPWGGRSGSFGQGGSSSSGSGSGGGVNIPSLQEASDSAGRGLQGGSNSFFDMLSTVANAFAESSGGGGGSFGSSRRGGFSGGGGSRRSGGGGSRSSGGGGGGRRGFG